MPTSFALDDSQSAPTDSTPLKSTLSSTLDDLSRQIGQVPSAVQPLPSTNPSRGTNPLPPVSAPTPTNPSRTTLPLSPIGSQPLPPLPSQYALSLLQQGQNPTDVVDAVNKAYHLQTGSQAVYYGNNNTMGFADGYYLAGPTFQNNLSPWTSIARGNESAAAGPSSADLTGLLTSLLSRFSAQPQNAIAAMPAPVAPPLAPQASSAQPTVTVDGVTSPVSFMTPPADLGGVSTQSVGPNDPIGPVVGGPVTSAPTGGVSRNGGLSPATGPSGAPDPIAAAAAISGHAPVPPTGAAGSATGDTSGNPFTDPTQMALWEAVQAALSQAQQPVGQNPQTQALYDAINAIAQQLQGPAFTDQQLNNIRTASMDSIQRDEDNAVQAEIQRQGLLGQSPTSGTVTDAVNKIKASYTTLKGQAQQANNIYELNTVDQRRQELLGALNLGAQTATNNTQTGFQNAVTGAELSSLPVTAENNALQNALSVTNASNPSTILSTILATIANNNQSGLVNALNNSQFAQQLGKIIAGFL